MAKGQLPRIDGTETIQQSRPQQEQSQKPDHTPIAEGYLPRRVDVKLPRHHARILRDKLRVLQDSGARLMDGTMVSDRTKTVLWIIENLVDKT